MRNLTTLCYLEQDGCYLMLHRVKKGNDVNKGKWIGVGGHLEEGESPEECLLREVREETGLTLTSFRFRALITFQSEGWETEYMCLYTADGFAGEPTDCDEGVLQWVDKEEVRNRNLWEGDRIFLSLLDEDLPFFSLKLSYRGDVLTQAVLNGQPMELLEVRNEDGTATGIVRERSLVHRYGDVHATVHIWVMRVDKSGNTELLLQKRSPLKDSFPGCYDISAAGHVRAFESCQDAAKRELFEELGIAADARELQFVGTRVGNDETTFYGKPFRNHEIRSVYVLQKPVEIPEMILQEAEVESVRWVNLAEIKNGMQGETCICADEVRLLENWLRGRFGIRLL